MGGACAPAAPGRGVFAWTVTRWWIAAGLAISLAVAPAAADTESVIVTARWRPEQLQQVPMSMSVFGADDLQQRNITNLSGIAPFTPNLVFDPGTGDTGGSTNAQVYIRGIGQADFLFNTEPGVGIYVDGVYAARGIGALMDLVDVDRIEVLEGPQGTLFGKNSVGGAINIVSREPGDAFAVRGHLTLGALDRHDAAVAMDVPLDDGLAAKLTAFTSNRDGFVASTQGGSALGSLHGAGAGLQLKWSPSAAFDLRLSADHVHHDETSAPTRLLAVNTAAPLLQLWTLLVSGPAGDIYDNRFVHDGMVNDGTAPNYSRLDQGGVSATAEWRVGGGLLRSITALRSQNANFGTDADQSPLAYTTQGVRDRLDQASEEIQWLGTALDGRLNYVLGGLYFAEHGRDDYRVLFAPGLYDALEALPTNAILGYLGGAGNPANAAVDYDGLVDGRLASQSLALFANAGMDLGDGLSLSLGVRQTWDSKTYRAYFDHYAAGVRAYGVAPHGAWAAATPTASLQYQWTPELMTYASASRGYKSGGFNGRAQSAGVAQAPFAPELDWTYEGGVKAAWPDVGLVTDLAVFHSDYDDMQLTTVGVDQGLPVVIVANAGAAEMNGFEFTSTAQLAPDFRLTFNAGFLDSHYTRLDNTVTGVTLASRLPKAPKWTASFGAARDFALEMGTITLSGDYGWRSTMANTADNTPALVQPGHGMADAQLAFRPAGSNWSVALFGSNLGDVRVISNGLNSLASIGILNATYGPPREWGVRVDYRE